MDLSLMRTENREDLGMQQPTIEIPDLFVANVPCPCCRSLLRTLATKGPSHCRIVEKLHAVHGHFNGLLGVMLHLNATGAVGHSGRFS